MGFKKITIRPGEEVVFPVATVSRVHEGFKLVAPVFVSHSDFQSPALFVLPYVCVYMLIVGTLMPGVPLARSWNHEHFQYGNPSAEVSLPGMCHPRSHNTPKCPRLAFQVFTGVGKARKKTSPGAFEHTLSLRDRTQPLDRLFSMNHLIIWLILPPR